MEAMNVLVACERSGRVRESFRRKGHNAWSCDTEPAEDGSQYHIQDDVRNWLDNRWDLMIGHPECRFLCNSGVRWLYEGGRRWNPDGSEQPIEPVRWQNMLEAVEFFLTLWRAPIERVVLENSVMHPHALERVGVPYAQSFQPYEFGVPVTKRTLLWIRNLPRLQPTEVLPKDQRKPAVHHESPGPQRSMNRARTFWKVAQAMADQWG